MRNNRPNIIFLLTDDQRENSLSVQGHPWVKTPNLDTLVRNGVRFTNTYIAEPTCSPSRTSLFMGMHERVHGVGFTSSYLLTEEQWAQSYPALLREHGYHTGFIGKFGVEFYTFKGKAAEQFDYWRAHDGFARFFPKTAENCAAYHDSAEEIITPVKGESIERFLQSAPPDKPFCLSVSFSVPHGSQTGSMHTTWDEPANRNPKLANHPIYGDLYRDLDIEIPAETGTDPYRFVPKPVMDQDQGRKKCYHYNYTRPKCHEHHIRYYQTITGMDKVVGDMMASLREKGLHDNTVIIFASDHGLLMGEYGMGGKALLYDLASKIPCFIYDPRLPAAQRGRSDDSLVSSLDITSTILDYAGIEAPVEMAGRSLRPLLAGKDVDWRQELFLENLFVGRDTPFSEGIRRGRWKYIRMFDSPRQWRYDEKDLEFGERTPDFEQLFDLQNDPDERNNLIAEYEGKALLADLRRRCRESAAALNRRREEYKATLRVAER